MYLLDLNLLIALCDPDHVHHAKARHFFNTAQKSGWATCPLTENGFLRIVGHPDYPKGPGSPEKARRLLQAICALPGHQFWPDSLSLRDDKQHPALPTSKHLTDYYLLALAVQHQARFATLDKRIDPTLLTKGPAAFCLVTR